MVPKQVMRETKTFPFGPFLFNLERGMEAVTYESTHNLIAL